MCDDDNVCGNDDPEEGSDKEHKIWLNLAQPGSTNNPHLKELELIKKRRRNCNCNCHIILSFDHIALLKKSGVRLVRRKFDRIFHPIYDSNTFIT